MQILAKKKQNYINGDSGYKCFKRKNILNFVVIIATKIQHYP